MIQVFKPTAPSILQKAGIARTKKDCEAYDANSDDYLDGTEKFEFSRDIYSHDDVRIALSRSQDEKCCFCEGRFGAFAPAHVEHYRPKGSTRQDKNSERQYPGYYWLAYSLDNLYWCCQTCNTNKSDFFPLDDPEKRARSHNCDLADEKPLILDPGGQEDPRLHIGFLDDIADSSTKAGQKTIEVIDLNRQELIDDRRDHLNLLIAFCNVIRLSDSSSNPEAIELRQDAQKRLRAAVQPAAVFSAMAADFLASTSYTEASEEITD